MHDEDISVIMIDSGASRRLFYICEVNMDVSTYKPRYKGLAGQSLVSLKSLSPEEIFEILHSAKLLKIQNAVEEKQTALEQKEILLIAKTAFSGMRIAFELAVKQLGGTLVVLPLGGTQIETLLADKDILPVISRYGIDGIAINTDDWRDAELLRANSTIPVINAHGNTGPCVALAAMMTCWEKLGKLNDKTIAVIGNMSAHRFIAQAAVKCGMKVHVISPEALSPDGEFIESSAIYGVIDTYTSLEKGLEGADAVFVTAGDRLGGDFFLSERAMEVCPNAIFLHPTPVDRTAEVDAAVCDGPRSAMLDMAGNLLHVEKAVLALTLGHPIGK